MTISRNKLRLRSLHVTAFQLWEHKLGEGNYYLISLGLKIPSKYLKQLLKRTAKKWSLLDSPASWHLISTTLVNQDIT
ncbi:MAG TPA: hypothetical protein DEV81_21680 [Cyanobacteria bacterium UBA11049]|nr:hypothetical protein [Cyanobacteria bacterium UBA11049]